MTDEKLYTKDDMARAIQTRLKQVKSPVALVELVLDAHARIDALEQKLKEVSK